MFRPLNIQKVKYQSPINFTGGANVFSPQIKTSSKGFKLILIWNQHKHPPQHQQSFQTSPSPCTHTGMPNANKPQRRLEFEWKNIAPSLLSKMFSAVGFSNIPLPPLVVVEAIQATLHLPRHEVSISSYPLNRSPLPNTGAAAPPWSMASARDRRYNFQPIPGTSNQ